MQVARPSFLGKTNTLTTVSRPSSCRSNWMRILVQSIFATITVTSFILIVIMAIKSPSPAAVMRPVVPPRCVIHSCRVVCKEVPYYDRHEEDILFTVMEAETECTRVVLELQMPYFVNNTLPENWLSRLRSNIHQLNIIRGNLNIIPAGAFMSHFAGNMFILVLQGLHITNWDATGLVGLSSLRTLNIINSQLEVVQENALRAVDDTLETLTITESGAWDPQIFTGARGFDKLTIVDFSYNDFSDILGPFSFVGLVETKILYLNACKITAIGAGAFDHLLNMEVLYLNNNKIVTIPPGLFSTIVALQHPRPRINLQDNYWYCDCSVDDFRQLMRKDVLLVEPTCTYPTEMNSLTFTEFENVCNGNSTDTEYRFHNVTLNEASNSSSQTYYKYFMPNPIYVNTNCCNSRSIYGGVKIISPLPNSSQCTSTKMQQFNASQLSDKLIRKFPKENHNEHYIVWPEIYIFLKTDKYSVVEVISKGDKISKYGLEWFQTSCPQDLYCLEEIPRFLQVYSAVINVRYTFCLMNLSSAHIEEDNCIGYDLTHKTNADKKENGSRIIIVVYFITSMLFCLCFGAVIVYGVIRARPTLLRGSKRIVFVKHRNIDALVLPPKVPARNDLKTNDSKKMDGIFTLSPNINLTSTDLNRMKSVRSNKSASLSYISAMQPTEDELAEWRIRHHFNNDLTVTSMKSELSSLSWVCGDNYYHSLIDSDTYESLK